MKSLLTLTILTFFSLTAYSQDTIYKRDGSRIEAKIVEITPSTIKYTKIDQPEGPIRNVPINEVRDIIYENGAWDKFELTQTTPQQNPTNMVIVPNRPARKEKDAIFGNGFFIEGLIGYSGTTFSGNSYKYREDEMSVQMRLGLKWYMGSQEKKWRPGIQLTFLRVAIYHDMEQPQNYSLSPANIGFANIFKFNEKNGLELNANVGFNVMNFSPPPFDYFDGDPGIIYGAEIKYRYKSLAVGLDYARINSNITETYPRNRNLISLSIGRKF